MKPRLVIAGFLLFAVLGGAGCSGGSAKDRTAQLQTLDSGYTTLLAADVTETKGYELVLVKDKQDLEKLAARTWKRSNMFGPNNGYDEQAFDFGRYDHVAVISKPKSGSLKYQIKSAAQASDGALAITLLETKPSVQTGDIQREIKLYRIPKELGVSRVELKEVQSQNSSPTH